MVVMNTSPNQKTIRLDRFSERTNKFSSAKNIVDQSTQDLRGEWKIPARTIWILELK
jgi:hypothetical protein